MKPKILTFPTDEEAERFIDTADLSEYDLSAARPVRFEFEKKDARGIPYQRFIREALERAVGGVRNARAIRGLVSSVACQQNSNSVEGTLIVRYNASD